MARLRDGLYQWYYGKQDRRRGKLLARRVQALWEKETTLQRSAIGFECMSIAAEALGQREDAVRYRRAHIASIAFAREHVKTGLPFARRSELERHDWDCTAWDLSQAYDLFAVALWNNDQLEAGLDALDESKRICRAFKLAFDARAVERDIRRELAARRKLIERTAKTAAKSKRSK